MSVSQSSIDDIASINRMMNDYLVKKNQYINNENAQVQDVVNILSSKTIIELDDLKKQVDLQNTAIEKQIAKDHGSTSHDTKYVKSEYQQIEIDKLKYQNYILYAVFYSLVSILGILILYSNPFGFVFQIFVILILFSYPFWIYYLEFFIYYIYQYAKSFFNSTKFSNIYLGDY
jgi:hypothetical protein